MTVTCWVLLWVEGLWGRDKGSDAAVDAATADEQSADDCPEHPGILLVDTNPFSE
ncbi:MAG: hypothetical protein ACI8Z1_000495 [Candidatus Azotimanducaceae bacterium]|jgi:hypothetical protein